MVSWRRRRSGELEEEEEEEWKRAAVVDDSETFLSPLLPSSPRQGCAAVVGALPSAPSLTSLNLRRCGADDGAAELVCKALGQGHGMLVLDLSGGR
jgi:hypothetical protein